MKVGRAIRRITCDLGRTIDAGCIFSVWRMSCGGSVLACKATGEGYFVRDLNQHLSSGTIELIE